MKTRPGRNKTEKTESRKPKCGWREPTSPSWQCFCKRI